MILSGKVRKTQKPLSPIAPRDQLTFSINIQLIQLNMLNLVAWNSVLKTFYNQAKMNNSTKIMSKIHHSP